MLITFLVLILLVAIDQVTKVIATSFLADIGSAPFIPGIIEFRYILNDGAAFSLFSGNRFLLIGVTGVSLIAMLVYLLWKKPSNKLEYASWLIILAGGAGNLIDRIRAGVVVDFFNFQFINFAVFNVADIFVTCGMALLIFTVCMEEYKLYKSKKIKADENESN